MQPHDTQYYTHTTWEYVPHMEWEGTKQVPLYVYHTHDARAQRRDGSTYRSRYNLDSQYMGVVEVPDIRFIAGGVRITKAPSMKVRKGNSKPKSKK